ncbi:MAG: GNAT family N-acetyltransferase [Myxococcales bacterium]|nr:GNAT family N-acetyltransferase [Myxococcales bacterium]
MTRIRTLESSDRRALERFLEARPDTTLFLQSNLARAGLVDDGSPHSGRYVAVVAHGRIEGVAASYWNGNVVLQSPLVHIGALMQHLLADGRAVDGLLGEPDQVQHALQVLGDDGRGVRVDFAEVLMALSLSDVCVPQDLADGRWCCRRPETQEMSQVMDWRVAYCVETLHEQDDSALRARVASSVERIHACGDLFVLLDAGTLVAMSAFNARTPTTVQVGGVYTPVALRRRGYGRGVVAGSLLHARGEGSTRSVLFSDNPFALRAYRAVGYRAVGDYRILSFEPRPRGAS